MQNLLFKREIGQQDKLLTRQLTKQRLLSLEFCASRAIASVHGGAITWLDLDHVEQRYLLAGAADASVAIYDVQAVDNTGETHALLHIGRGHPSAHKYTVSTVAWYPIDTGLFVTGSYDHEVKVWDTNTQQVACQFSFLRRNVYAVSMSPVAVAHCLVAVGSEEAQVKLCDPASGGFTHTLVGHRDAVWGLHWALDNEWLLLSGGADGEVRLWDIRRSTASLHSFDQHATSRVKAPKAEDRQVRRDFRSADRLAQSAVANHAVAHAGAVTAVLPTPNGLYWISAGTDNKVRLWDAAYRTNTLVNFHKTFNSSRRGRQLAVSPDSSILFHPSGSAIQMLQVANGREAKLLRGHMDTVNCCCFNADSGELYSGSSDSNILVWAPKEREYEEVVSDGGRGSDEDAWSD